MLKMKGLLRLLFTSVLFVSPMGLKAQLRDTLNIFDHVRFYDGYLVDKNPDSLLTDGILRHRTSLYAVKMSEEQLSHIGSDLQMEAFVHACCDNYDRIGNINLAFVPKGQTKYTPDSVSRIELARFVTPFMDKNRQPDTAPYYYSMPYASFIFNDPVLRSKYDYWMEFELFGVPYAANKQVAGCEGRSDVFLGSLRLISRPSKVSIEGKHVLVPIVIKKPEYIGHNLNNYNAAATDTLGRTTKTYTFTVPREVADAQIVLITSNHGANEGGEEYNRRHHYVCFDGKEVMAYVPGRAGCEPFRRRNTQANGIYGREKRTKEEWQSFSNWCPGDVIDTRLIHLGRVGKGTHTLRISVPDAVFNGAQGDIPVSAYFQGLTKGTLPPAW